MTTPVPLALREADVYSKLLRIQSQVVAGEHPRLKLSLDAIKKCLRVQGDAAASKQPPTPPVHQSLPLLNGEPGVLHSETHRVNPGFVPEKTNAIPKAQPPTVVSNVSQKSTFNPVLPRKPADPLRAELALKRQRLERSVQNAAEAQRDSHDKTHTSNVEGWGGAYRPDITRTIQNVTLEDRTAAQIKPLKTNEPDASDSSFDENSYYSSKVNSSWSSALEEGELEPDSPNAVGREADTSVIQVGSVQVVAESNTGRPSQLSTRNADALDTTESTRWPVRRRDNDESYSPPPIRVSPQLKRKAPTRLEDAAPRGPRAMQPPTKAPVTSARRLSNRERDSESYSPPPPNVPVIRNTIAAPLAPQPSRISSLTSQQHGPSHVTKPVILAGQNKQSMTQNQRVGQQQSNNRTQVHPRNISGTNGGVKGGAKGQKQDNKAGSKQPQQQQANQQKQQQKQAMVNTSKGQQNRKRKADGPLEGRTNGHREVGNRVVSRPSVSPEPYIKPEPVSPGPPVGHHHPPPLPLRAPRNIQSEGEGGSDGTRRLILRRDGRAEVESDSPLRPAASTPRSTAQRADMAALASPYQLNGANGPPSSYGTVFESPQLVRRHAPDSRDLRRVASMQYASQISPSSSMYAPRPQADDIRYVRAPSRQITQYDDEELQPMVRYQQPGRYGSPMQLAPEYGIDSGLEREDRIAMPPPAKKRIIVLDDGEEWLAIPNPTSRRQSVARTPAPTAPRIQYIDEPAPTPRVRYIEESAAQQHPYYTPTFQSRSERAPSIRRRQPEIINLEDEDDFHRMPPPMSVRRRVDVDEQLRHALVYQNQERTRAASVQAMSSARHDPYQQLSANVQYVPVQQGPPAERAYSVQPQLHQPQVLRQPQMFAQDPGYGRQPLYGQQRPDVHTGMW